MSPVQISALSRERGHNDELIELAARKLHGVLPLPVRLVIRPQRLTDWCLANRERVLAAIRPAVKPGPPLS